MVTTVPPPLMLQLWLDRFFEVRRDLVYLPKKIAQVWMQPQNEWPASCGQTNSQGRICQNEVKTSKGSVRISTVSMPFFLKFALFGIF